jgi:hypothetical protein
MVAKLARGELDLTFDLSTSSADDVTFATAGGGTTSTATATASTATTTTTTTAAATAMVDESGVGASLGNGAPVAADDDSSHGPAAPHDALRKRRRLR